MTFWPADDVERVFKAVADFSRQRPEPSTPPIKRSTLPPKVRAKRIDHNKAARKARRQNRSK